jgi:hypothetical protein
MMSSTRVGVGTGRQADETVKSGIVPAADGLVGLVPLAVDAEMSIAVRDGLTAGRNDRLLLGFGIRAGEGAAHADSMWSATVVGKPTESRIWDKRQCRCR